MKTSTKAAIAKVVAGPLGNQNIGTAFLVAERFLLTALHVVGNRAALSSGANALYEPIEVTFEGTTEAVVAQVVDGKWSVDEDWALLRIEGAVPTVAPIPLATLDDGILPEVEMFGYPEKHNSLAVSGRVQDPLGHYFDTPAIQLYSDNAAAGIGDPLNGLSGAPCMIGPYVVGVVRAHPIGRFEGSVADVVTIRNGVLYACPVEFASRACAGLIGPTRLISKAAIRQVLARDEHLDQFARYEEGLRRLTSHSLYDIRQGAEPDAGQEIFLHASAANVDLGPAAQAILSALVTSRTILVEAPAGAGKSTVLFQIAASSWSEPGRLGQSGARTPVYARMKDLARARGATYSERFGSAIAALPFFAMLGGAPEGDFLSDWSVATNAPLLVLLDGLDEVSDTERAALLAWLRNMMRDMPTVRVVVTTRDSSLFRQPDSEGGDKVTLLQLRPPTLAQATEIASRWTASDAGTLIRALEELQLGDVLETPLGVSLAASVYAEDHAIPNHRAGLYERFVQVSLRNAIRRGLPNGFELSAKHLEHLLQALAWHELCHTRMPDSAAERVLAESLTGIGQTPVGARLLAPDILQFLAAHSGILGRDGEWRHSTLREFLAAQHLADGVQSGTCRAEEFLPRHADPAWRGTLLFLFSLWSRRFSGESEEALDELTPYFEAVVGVPISRPKQGWLGRLLRMEPKELPPLVIGGDRPSATVAFAAEAIVELGRAPRFLERRIIESVLFYKDDIARTFTDPCQSYFHGGDAHLHVRIVRRWGANERLRASFQRFVDEALRDIEDGQIDYSGPAGLLLLYRAEDRILELIRREAKDGKFAAGAAKALKWWDCQRSQELRVEAVLSLDARNDAAQKDFEEMDRAFALAHVTSLPPMWDRENRVIKRFDVFLHAAQSKHAGDEGAALRYAVIRDSQADLALLAELHEANPSATTIEHVFASFEREGRFRSVFADPALPVEIRKYASWWYGLPESKRTECVILERLECVIQLMSRAKEASAPLAEALDQLATGDLLALMHNPYASDGLVGNVIEKLRAEHREKVVQLGLDPSNDASVRFRILAALFGCDPFAKDIHQPLLAVTETVLSSDPRHLAGLRVKSAVLAKMNRTAEAEELLNEIINTGHGTSEDLARRADLRLDLGGLEEALSDIDAALLSNASAGYWHYVRGRILRRLDRDRDALDAFKRSDWDRWGLYSQKVDVLIYLGLVDEALKVALEASESLERPGEFLAAAAFLLSSQGRTQESIDLLVEHEDILQDQCDALLAKAQNAFALADSEAFDKHLFAYRTAVPDNSWAVVLEVFFHRKSTGVWSDELIARLESRLAREPDAPNDFWLAVARNSRRDAESVISVAVAGKDERTLRWVLIDGKGPIAQLLPKWTDKLFARVATALARLEEERTSAPVVPATKPVEVVAPRPTEPRKTRKVKYLVENGLICPLAGIETYDEEKAICDSLLREFKHRRAAVIMPLLNTGYVYIQSNVVWEAGDDYPFKLLAPYARLRDEGALVRELRRRNIEAVLVTNQNLHSRMCSHPGTERLRDILIFRRRELPYSEDDVEWEFRDP